MSLHTPQPGPGLRPVAIPMMQVLQGAETAMQDAQGPRSLIEARAAHGRWIAPEEGSPRAAMLETAMGLIRTPCAVNTDHDFDSWIMLRRCAEAAGCDVSLGVRREGSVWGGVRADEARRALLSWGFREIRPERAEPGDVILFFMKGDAAWAGDDDFVHPAVLSEPGGRFSGAVNRFDPKSTARMVHAYWARACCEAWVGAGWEGRTLTAFTLDRGLPPRPANDARPVEAEAA